MLLGTRSSSGETIFCGRIISFWICVHTDKYPHTLCEICILHTSFSPPISSSLDVRARRCPQCTCIVWKPHILHLLFPSINLHVLCENGRCHCAADQLEASKALVLLALFFVTRGFVMYVVFPPASSLPVLSYLRPIQVRSITEERQLVSSYA